MTGRPPRIVMSFQTWVVIGMLGLGIFGAVLFYSGQQNAKHAAHAAADAAAAKAIAEGERSARFTQKRAAVDATYNACLRSIPTLRNATAFVEVVSDLAADLLGNSIRNHRATPRSNPQWAAQEINIRTLRKRYVSTLNLRFPVPTKAKCRARHKEDLAALAAAKRSTASASPV